LVAAGGTAFEEHTDDADKGKGDDEYNGHSDPAGVNVPPVVNCVSFATLFQCSQGKFSGRVMTYQVLPELWLLSFAAPAKAGMLEVAAVAGDVTEAAPAAVVVPAAAGAAAGAAASAPVAHSVLYQLWIWLRSDCEVQVVSQIVDASEERPVRKADWQKQET